MTGRALPDKVAIQLNDTHPTLAVPELMRLLLDEAKLGWDDAWDLTQRTLAYTNHTLLPEALEKWPVQWFQDLLPRHLEIIYEINRRFLDDVRAAVSRRRGPRRARQPHRRRRGPASPHGASGHRRLAQHQRRGRACTRSCSSSDVVPDFAAMFPERFNNKTNGVTPRRWLLLANPSLAAVITDAIGDRLDHRSRAVAQNLKPLADDTSFRAAVRSAKREAKVRFLRWLATSRADRDPDTHFRHARSSASTNTNGNC